MLFLQTRLQHLQNICAPPHTDASFRQRGGLALAFREAALGAGIKDIQYPQQRGIYMQKLLQILGLNGLNEDIQNQAAQGSAESAALAKSLESMRNDLMVWREIS